MLGMCNTTVVTEYFADSFAGIVFRDDKDPLSIRQMVSLALGAARGMQVRFWNVCFERCVRFLFSEKKTQAGCDPPLWWMTGRGFPGTHDTDIPTQISINITSSSVATDQALLASQPK